MAITNKTVANRAFRIAWFDVTIFDSTGSKEIFWTREYVVINQSDYERLKSPANEDEFNEDEYSDLLTEILFEPLRRQLCIRHGLRLVLPGNEYEVYDHEWSVDEYGWM